jgi:hypothetical protein
VIELDRDKNGMGRTRGFETAEEWSGYDRSGGEQLRRRCAERGERRRGETRKEMR